MTYSVWQRFIVDESTGSILAGATVRVRKESDGLDATIYSDDSGTGLSNPFASDENGFAQFYAAGGLYRITITSGAYTADLRDVPIGQAGAYDVGVDADGKLLTKAGADGLYQSLVQDNNTAVTAPTVNDDETAGYSIRSLWFNTSVSPVDAYICLDPAAGAAVWELTTLTAADLGSAATKNVGTASDQIPTNGDLGTASTKDTGTADAQVPTNADLAVNFFTISGNITLDSTHNRRTGYITANAVITLPAHATSADGYAVELLQDGAAAHTVTLAPAGTDTVRSSETVVDGDCTVVKSPTAGQWLAVGEVSAP